MFGDGDATLLAPIMGSLCIVRSKKVLIIARLLSEKKNDCSSKIVNDRDQAVASKCLMCLIRNKEKISKN